MHLRTLSIIAVVLHAASTATAGTMTVRRDGTGDFTVIQDAVNAAASGDTIRIGPGRYDEGTIVQVPGWTELVRVLVTVEDLTLIGAGDGLTIIGQAGDWDLSQGGHRGIQTATRWGTRRLVVEGIRFENMKYAINDDDIEELCIRNCSFSGNFYSVLDFGGVLEIADSAFESVKRDGLHLATWVQSSLRVSNCRFAHVPDGAWAQASVSIAGVQNGEFANCEFLGGAGGLSISSGTRTAIRRCVFDGQTTGGIYSGLACNLTVEDCTMVEQGLAFRLASDWTIQRTTVSDARTATLWISDFGRGTMRDCLLAKGARFVVSNGLEYKKADGSPIHYDLRNNWWGTDNPDSIQAWIYDANDYPESGYIIDWQPFNGEPLPTTKRSLGSVKSLFR